LSLYHLMPKDEWRGLKERLFAEEGRKCYICGSTSRGLSAHEFWEYDDERHIQKLAGIHHLCYLCHKIKHIGFWLHTHRGTEELREEGLTREDLIGHFCTVNGCSPQDFDRCEDEAFEVWRRRSKCEWKQDLGEYEKYGKAGT